MKLLAQALRWRGPIQGGVVMATLQASAGQSACFALKKIKRTAVRKGMVIVARERNPIGAEL